MIINPDQFESVVEWADRMTFLLEPQIEQVFRLDDPEQWRVWAMQTFGEPDNLGQDSPDPYQFDNWRDWAERLFQTQDFSG